MTVNAAVLALPAGSVASIVMWLTPVVSGRRTVNVPSASAVLARLCALSAFRAIRVERAWTLPLIVTLLPLITALFFGEVMVTLGFDVSST